MEGRGGSSANTNCKLRPANSGRWSLSENKSYLKFLLNNKDQFATKYLRKSNQIFCAMAKNFPSRTADQCRTHHQKFENQSGGNIDIIVSRIKMKI